MEDKITIKPQVLQMKTARLRATLSSASEAESSEGDEEDQSKPKDDRAHKNYGNHDDDQTTSS